MPPQSLRLMRSLCLSVLAFSVLVPSSKLSAQSSAPDVSQFRLAANRIVEPVNDNVRLTLKGTVHRLANPANDRGLAPASLKLERVQILFRRSQAQETALTQLIDQLHAPGSAQYHKWLTPDQFGQQFGPSDADVAKVQGWLQSHGFTVTALNPGRQTLEFTGTAGQFRAAFRAPIHMYQIAGRTRYANAADPQIPAALAPVVAGFVSLNNFPLKSQARKMGTATYDLKTHVTRPGWTVSGSGGTYYAITPGDFAIQYDLNPLYTAATPLKGDGQSIAIVNDSNIDIALVNRYRALFNLPPNPPQVIIDGNDPGIDGINDPYGANGDAVEAYLDVELAGAVAPDATVNLVIAADTPLINGLSLAAERAVYSNVSPVISISFIGCEQNQGMGNQFWSNLWEQGAAQGITVMVAAGDSGSATCDDFNTQAYAVNGQAVNGIASTPYDIAVGGTDFYYDQYNSTDPNALNTQIASYWNTTPSNGAPTVSLQGPVPEQPLNGSQYGMNAAYYDLTIFAGGGGSSNCATGVLPDGQYYDFSSCTAGYPKPSWQAGVGDSVRDLPDVALFASDGYNYSFYAVCVADGDCQPASSDGFIQFGAYGGTSLSSPAFAGILALVNQRYGRQGQANYVLYPLAQQYPSAFHDVATGTNSVPCNIDTVTDSYTGNTIAPNDCIAVSSPFNVFDARYGNSDEGQVGLSGTPSYNAGAGYDLASGLGSIDAANLVKNWGNVHFGGSSTTLTPSSTSFKHGTAITVSGAVIGSSPTGDVALISSSSEYAEQGQANFPLSDGAFSASVTYLPGGTYNIWGRYSGDTKNTTSTSTPVSITVSPEDSTTQLTISTTDGTSVTSGSDLIYGSPYILAATPQSASSSSAEQTPSTGKVVFSDGSTAIKSAVINDDGQATYTYAATAGSHSVTAAFLGDNSYNASKSSAVTFTVEKATPLFEFDNYGTLPLGQVSYLSVLLENNIFPGPGSLPPTGTITVAGGPPGSTTSAMLLPAVDPGTGVPAAIAIFTVPASAPLGIYNGTLSYAGDTNYTAGSSPFTLQVGGPGGGLPTTITASSSATSTSPASQVYITATVNGRPGVPAPTGEVILYDDLYDFIGTVELPIASGSTVTVTTLVDHSSLPVGVDQLIVYYAGDVNYGYSQTTLTIDNSLADFSLLPDSTLLTVPATGAMNEPIAISSFNGFAGNVFLSCSASTGIACSIVPSVKLASGGTAPATLTVNTAGVTAAGTYDVVVTGVDGSGAYIHNIGFQVATPKVTSPPVGPVGNLELAVDNATKSTSVSQAHALFVSGWAADPADGAPLANVKLYLDGMPFAAPATGIARPDVATYFSNSSYTNSGFDLSFNAANLNVGAHTVLAIATDAAGLAATLGPLTFTVTAVPGPPVGNLELAVDSVTSSTTVSQQHQVMISGWIADPVDGSPLSNVKVSIDGSVVGAPTLGLLRPDVAGYFHNNTYLHSGYTFPSYVASLSVGPHTVTVTGTDSQGLSTTFGPKTFTVAAQSNPPVGNLESAVDSVTGSSTLLPSGTLFVGGWAADYHDDGPAKSVQVFIDGIAIGYATLGQPRPDVESYFGNTAWSNTGWTFDYSVSSLSGSTHTVTAIAKDSLGLTTVLGPATFNIAGLITTYAGNGTPGYSTGSGSALSAELQFPYSNTVDGSGNLYIADTYNFAVRKVTPAGVITTIAGNGGSQGNDGDGGPATSAHLGYINAVTLDSSGNLYIADSSSNVIRKVDSSGNISTVAGNGTNGYTGDGGPALSAQLNYPDGLAIDSGGNLYIADAPPSQLSLVSLKVWPWIVQAIST